MRILHVAGMTSRKYGSIEQHFVHLARACRERGHDLWLLTNVVPGLETFVADVASAGARIHVMPCQKVDARLVTWIWRTLTRERVDVAHANFSPASHVLNLLACVARTPLRLWTIQSMSEIYGTLRSARNPMVIRQRISGRFVHKVIGTSRAIRDDFIALGLPASKFEVLPIGVRLDRYRATPAHRMAKRSELGLAPTDVVIGTVSRAEHVKGLEFLVAAGSAIVRDFPEIRVVIVGGGSLMPELERRAREAGVADRFVFLGIREDIPELLSAFDVFALPSRSEGMPFALVEAAAAGLPLVGSDVGGIPEVIDDGRNGYVFPAGDVDALAQRLGALIASADLRAKMGGHAREGIGGHHDVRVQTERLLDLYERALAVTARRRSRGESRVTA